MQGGGTNLHLDTVPYTVFSTWDKPGSRELCLDLANKTDDALLATSMQNNRLLPVYVSVYVDHLVIPSLCQSAADLRRRFGEIYMSSMSNRS